MSIEATVAKLRSIGLRPMPTDGVADLPGVSVPSVYTDVLQSLSGGEFEQEVVCRMRQYPPKAHPGLWPVEALLAPGGGEWGLATWYERLAGDETGAGLVPFALASGGDLYCFFGDSVVFWDHESGLKYWVAHDFEDFVDRLEVDSTEVPKEVLSRARLTLDPDLL